MKISVKIALSLRCNSYAAAQTDATLLTAKFNSAALKTVVKQHFAKKIWYYNGFIVVAATHDTSHHNDAGGITECSRSLSEATPPDL